MKSVSIYQTLEDRGNYQEVEQHGPYMCYTKDSNGNYKTGTKTPWLGEGYYFWDSFIDDAHWWGRTAYKKNGSPYIIGKTTYDQHSPLLFDTVSDPLLLRELIELAEVLKTKLNIKCASFPLLLGYLKKTHGFKYKAIRVHPDPIEYHIKAKIKFPGNMYVLNKMEKIQICFFDKTLLTEPFRIVYPQIITEDYAI